MTPGDPAIAVAVIIGVPLALGGWVFLSERVIRRSGRNTQSRWRPWIWLLPGLVLMGTVLVYPLLATLRMSFGDRTGEGFTGLRNYEWALTDPQVLQALLKSVLWIAVLPVVLILAALLIAILADRVRYERIVITVVMIPSALSLVVAGVIWSLMYRYSPPGRPQVGLLNAVWTSLSGQDPVAWTLEPGVADAALMLIGMWAWLGFATVLLSAGVKGIPAEYLEAARLDGANEWQVFTHVTLPQLIPTIVVVLTTLVVWALKVFDIVYVVTGGRNGTDVLATRVYKEFFTSQQMGQGAAIAIILFLVAVPMMAFNIWRIRREESFR